ncbi:MAG: hypothetical protein RL479_1431 [Verrucomicrobiota bacterium]
MKDVFVDTSAFYAALDASDAFHRRAASLVRQAETEGWRLITTNYVVQDILGAPPESPRLGGG